MAKTYLSADELRAAFRYEPSTGEFFRITRTHKFSAGSKAGSIGSYGYWYIGHKKERYLAHRLAFLHMTGAVPPHHVDHINGVRTDNRWINLRAVSHSVNLQNMRRPRKDNTHGFQGAQRVNGGAQWRARIRVNGKQVHLGCFETPQEAHDAYLIGKRKLHEGCTI